MTLADAAIKLEILLEISVGSPIGQLRAIPVCLGEGAPRSFLVVYAADFDVDPYVEMFFFPSDTLKMALVTDEGKILWRRDLGRGVVPGVWFCPVLAFDLDGDGVDEIWFVDNADPNHPLGLSNYRLERIDARDGGTTGQWRWPNHGGRQTLSHTFRNFIVGGHVRGEPVLVTAQGTYGDMFLQGWRPGVSLRWEHHVARDTPGARGGHMCPITDLDRDGVQELMWGERCIELDGGTEIFCADRDVYRGHSDVIQPVLDRAGDQWFIYTCRESDPDSSPRVLLFDGEGRRVWGQVNHGHIDMGWVARLGEDGAPIATAIRIGQKTCGPDGRFHYDRDEFTFDALTGETYRLPFSTYHALPVDLSGDGQHELVYGLPGGDGTVINRQGNRIGNIDAPVAMVSQFLNRPGEQILAYYPNGTVRVWADRNAKDSSRALARTVDPLYKANQRLSGVGYNLPVLGGL